MALTQVKGSNIEDGTVVAADVAADAVDGTKIADNAVDSEHYTDGSIDAAHLAANSVDSAAYVDGSIDLAHLSADSVDGTKIADNAINSEHYTDGSIDVAHMSVNSIDSDQYVDGSIDEAHIANDAVNFATHLKAGTDGELITWDASGNPAAVAVGTATHVLTSGGAGVAPTFAAAAAGGAWEFVSKTTITSSTASVEFTGLTTDKDYMLSMVGHFPVTDNVWRVAHLGVTGPTYRTSNYLTKSQNFGGVDNQTGNMFDAYSGQGNATDEHGVTTLIIYDPANASTDTFYSYNYGIANSSGTTQAGIGFGHYTTSEAHTAVKFTFSSGNIAAGVFRLYSRTII